MIHFGSTCTFLIISIYNMYKRKQHLFKDGNKVVQNTKWVFFLDKDRVSVFFSVLQYRWEF